MMRPLTRAEFETLAMRMADSAVFAGAETVRCSIGVWPEETERWWTRELEAKVAVRCALARARATAARAAA